MAPSRMLLAALVAAGPSVAWGQGSGAPAGAQAEMPDLDADLTAYRVDCDVFGARSEPPPEEKPLPTTSRASELFDEEGPGCGGLLRDCR